MARVILFFLSAALLTAGCESAQQRKARENESIRAEAAKEIRRVCALPEAERQAELEKIKKESGMVLYCGSN